MTPKIRRPSLLIVTGHAVVRCLLLLVALDAKTHRVNDNFLRYSHVRNISMTRGTLDFGANMGGMIELNVRLLHPSVDALPRNVFAFFLILKDLHSFRGGSRFIRVVTRYACRNAGNVCDGTFVDAIVAVIALTFQARLVDVNGMGVRDRLLGLGPDSKEMPECLGHRRVSRGKNR